MTASSFGRLSPARRGFLLGSAAFAAALAAGLPARAQDLSGEITLMSYASLFQDQFTKAVVEPFMAANPGVTVNYFAGGTSAAMLGQLRAQAGDPQIDVAIFDAAIGLIGNREGLLAPLTVEEIPNMADLVPQATVQEGYGPAVTLDNFVIVYDTAKGEVTSITDFWKPEAKGRIAISALPNIQGACVTAITSQSLGEDYTQSIAQAVAKLAELAPSVQTFDPKPDGYTMIMNGDLDMATGWNARAQYYSEQSGGKLGVATPSEGSVLQINTVNLVQGAKNPDVAKAFIDYALSPEAQAAFTEAMYYIPVNAKAEISEAAMAKTSTGDLDSMLPFDWSWYSTVAEQWSQIWRRQIIGG